MMKMKTMKTMTTETQASDELRVAVVADECAIRAPRRVTSEDRKINDVTFMSTDRERDRARAREHGRTA